MRLLSVLLFVMLVPAKLASQSFPYTFYSVREGLPHSNVYAINQDQQGYMWFGTENGLTRFDGTAFVSFFGNNEVLSSGAVTSLLISDGPVIYAGSSDNRVYRIDDSRVSELSSNKSSLLTVSSLGVQEGNVFVFHDFMSTDVIQDAGSSQRSERIIPVINKSAAPLCSQVTRDGVILVGRKNGLFKIIDGVESPFVAEYYNHEPVYSIFEDHNGDLHLGAPGKIFKIRNGKVLEIIAVNIRQEQNIKVLLKDDCGNYWLSFWGDDNLYILTPDKTLFNLFENSGIRRGIVSRMFKDREGDVWLSILGNGLYRFSNLYLKNHTAGELSQGSFLTCMDVSLNDYIVFGTYNGLLFHHRESNHSYHAKLSPQLLEYVRDIRIKGNRVYAGITDMRLESMPERDYELIAGSDTFFIQYRHASSLQEVGEQIYLGNWDNEIILEGSNGKQFSDALIYIFKNYESARISCMYLASDSKIYIGTQLGLVVLGLHDKIKYAISNEVLSASVNRIVKGKSVDEIVVYTDNGVCTIRNGAVVSSLKNKGANRITAIRELNDGSRFIGTSNGLYYYSNHDSIHFSLKEGLPANQVNDLYYDGKYRQLIAITNSGFTQISTGALRNFQPVRPRILASSIETASRKIYFSGSASIPYAENLKLLNFSSVNDPGNYRYVKVTTGGGKTFLAASNKFDLSELSPGTNSLKACYIFEDGTEGPSTLIEINLIPPFYRTTWFYLLAGISGTGLSFIGYRRRKRNIEQKSHERKQVEYKISLLKQQALVSNLNPHFIFNALNAIQHYVNSNNLQNANEYLTLFSKLMRQHLNSANRDLIPVEEETDRLKNYLDIEKLRFGDKLEYEITISDRIHKLDVAIPNMIIQPFMENAIWHGFKGASERGKISLSMDLDENDNLEIRISDNGRGIGNAQPGSSSGKDPRGISLIRERLELLSGTNFQVLTFSELVPGSQFPGTVVTIRLTPRMYRIAN